MRTNIDIDDDLLAEAMQAGPYTSKRETVEAGLRLLARQAAYREILKWRGKLAWEGDASSDWTQHGSEVQAADAAAVGPLELQESPAAYPAPGTAAPSAKASSRAGRVTKARAGRRAGR